MIWNIDNPEPLAMAVILDVYAIYALHDVLKRGYVNRSGNTRRGVWLLEKMGLLIQDRRTNYTTRYVATERAFLVALYVPTPNAMYEAIWGEPMAYGDSGYVVWKCEGRVALFRGKQCPHIFDKYKNYYYAEAESNYKCAYRFLWGEE